MKVQHFFVCRLASMDVTQRHGPEIDEPCGEYEIVRVPFSRVGIAAVHLVPLSCATIWTATSRAYGRCTPPT